MGIYKLPIGNTRIFEAGEDFSGFSLDHARWNEAAGAIVCDAQAVVESPEIAIDGGFDEAIVSWNGSTPAGSYVTIQAQARVGSEWTAWYDLGQWNTDGHPRPRTSIDGQDDEHGRVLTDTLVMKQSAQAIRIKLQLGTSDGSTYPTLRRLAVNTIDSHQPAYEQPPYKQAWGVDLDVPEMSQLSVTGGAGWCSPTSVAMALGYWAGKLERPDLRVNIEQAARGTHDEAWGGTGNWAFNTAYAGEFAGIRAFAARLNGIGDIEKWIAAGVPVIVSVNYALVNPASPDSHGHLMVIRGFTTEGDPVFNDPWTRSELDETVRRVYPRESLERSWSGPQGTHGTVYLIHPE